ncbi:MAG: VCBS repeat-containing protein, partial [Verrucomicrobia bacterium]|nr:VCBS repeat-containing protein [Verrucomicrobiota bacterium]
MLPAALAWLGWFALGQTAEPVDLARAEALARQYCITCHLFPEPDLLDKKTWTSQVMPRMAIRMGLSPESVNQHPEADALWKSGRFLREPLITKADYFAIVEYYKAKAPEEAVAQKPVAPIGLDFRQFTARPSRFRRSVGAVNMVRIDEARRRIYHSDGINKFLDVLDSDGNWVESLQVGNVPVEFAENGGDFFLTMIGTFTPSDIPRGELALLRHENGAFVLKKTVLPKIPRPTHTNFADLNGDGSTDLIVSMYGNNIGRLSWFEKKENGDYAENILLPRSGTLSTAVHDFNGDGHPDIASLVAQEVEAMYLFLNDGKGVFTQQMVF